MTANLDLLNVRDHLLQAHAAAAADAAVEAVPLHKDHHKYATKLKDTAMPAISLLSKEATPPTEYTTWIIHDTWRRR